MWAKYTAVFSRRMTDFHPLTVREVRRETADCVSILLAPRPEDAERFRFTAGQYLTLRTELDGAEVRRSYSICTAPASGELRVAVKRVPDGRFSTWANAHLAPGDVLEAMAPAGRFTHVPQPARPLHHVGFAAGSGITPVLGILETVLQEEPESTFTLFYVNKDAQSVIFKERLHDLKDRFLGRLRLFHLLTREPMELELFHGRLDKDRCTRILNSGLLPAGEIGAAWLCGPESMITDCRDALRDAGVPEDRVHFELFTSAGSATKTVSSAPATGTEVAIVLDGITTTVRLEGTRSILDAALDAGLDAPYSCLGGVCCTCRARMTSGKAEMAINYALEPREVEQGFILTCQARPVGEGPFVVDYDQQ